VDGGMCANSGLLQFQSDISQTEVSRPVILETTALGAAYVAGLAVGFWKDTNELASKWKVETKFNPKMQPERRAALLNDWKKAIQRSMGWVDKQPVSVPLKSSSSSSKEYKASKSDDNFFDGPVNSSFKDQTFFDEVDEDMESSLSSSRGKNATSSWNKSYNDVLHPLMLLGIGVMAGVLTTKILSRN
jgi:hypothetical protein